MNTILATGHRRHVVTTIDKPVVIRVDAYEFVEEICNDIRHKPREAERRFNGRYVGGTCVRELYDGIRIPI